MNKKAHNHFYKKDGFTYVELLIVVGIMIIFGVFFVMAVDPVGKIKAQRDSQRESDINSILLSVEQKIRNDRGWNCPAGPLPQDKFTAIGTGPGEYDLYSCLTPNYLSKYLVDPKEGSIAGRNITDGLVGHWKFDEGSGTTAYDASGNDNHGTLVNGPSWVDGKIGGALEFDGVGDYVVISPSSSIEFSTFSYSAWVKTNSASGYRTIIDRDNDDFLFALYNGQLILYDPTIHSGYYLSSDLWYHVMLTYDLGQPVRFYINGQLVYTSPSNMTVTHTNSQYGIGSGAVGAPNEVWDGQIDDVRIYNRALSPAEIQDLYNYEYSSKYAIWQNPVTKNISLKSLESETKEVSTGAPD